MANQETIHLTVETKEMTTKLTQVSGIQSRKNSLLILDDVLLECKDGEFQLTGYHNDGHSLTLPVALNLIEGSKQWKVCLPVKRLLPIVRSLPQSGTMQLYLNTATNVMTATYFTAGNAQQGEFSLPVDSAEDFPEKKAPNEADIKCIIEVDTDWLLSRMRKAKDYTLPGDVLRPQLQCVAIDPDKEGNVTVVASDTHVLFKDTLSIGLGSEDSPVKYGEPRLYMVHAGLVSVMCEAFQGTEKIRLVNDGTRIYVTAEDGTTELIITDSEQKYPNYNAVIPKEQKHEAVCSVSELTATLKRVALFASESTQMVVMEFKGGNLSIAAENIDYAQQAKEGVTLHSTNLPDGFKIGFKATALLTALGSVETDNAVLRMIAKGRPLTIHNEDVNSGLCCLCMPMLLEEDK